MAIVRADQESQLARALVAQPAKEAGERIAAKRLAAFIEQYFRRAGGRWQRCGIGKLGQRHRPADPRKIAARQLGLGRLAGLSIRDDVKLQRATGLVGLVGLAAPPGAPGDRIGAPAESKAHIFSSA